MSKEHVSQFAAKILRRIADGRKAIAEDDGGARIGRDRVPPVVIATLLSRDLIRRHASRLEATDMGHAFLRRRASPPKPPVGETVAGERAQHMRLLRGRREKGDAAARTVVNAAESPLGWLRRRRGKDGKPLLDERQVQAGERLRDDFERAGLGPRVTRSYDAPPISASRRAAPETAEPTEVQLDARRRVDRACRVLGPGMSDIVLRVCCFLEGLETAERELGWPVRSGKLVLALALDRLADHYDGKR